MKKNIIVMICALLMTVSGMAETLSLDDCIQMAVTNNPDLQKSGFAVSQSDIAVRQAWSALLPNASASASTSNSGPFVSNMADDWNWSLGGSVNMPLYSPGLYTRIPQSEARQASAEYAFASQRDQIQSAVEKLYYQILTSDTLIAVYDANIALAQEQIRKMRQMVDLGMKRESDLLKSEVQRGTFEAQRVREMEALASSRRGLNILMGRRPETPFDLMPLEVDHVRIPDFEAALELMRQSNPLLKRLKAQVDVQKLSLRIAKEAFLPSVSGSYSYSRRNDALGGTPSIESDQVNVHLSLDLFDGFNKTRNIQVSNLNLDEARLDYEAALRDADDALQSQYKAMETQNRLVTIHQTNLASARKDLEVVSEQYAAGFSTILDLTDAQVSVAVSETSLLQDLYARKRIEAEIRRLMGTGYVYLRE